MSFDTKNGTRGASQPGKVMQVMNKMMINRVRKSGKAMGMNALALTTVGRKSGLERTTPLAWFPGKDGSWLIVASAAGAANNPAWYYNLGAHPDKVKISMAGKEVDVTADQIHGTERTEAWQQIVAAAPNFGTYQTKTDREIPVIRLVPRSS